MPLRDRARERMRHAADLYKAGVPTVEIQKRTGVGSSGVLSAAIMHGLESRRDQERTQAATRADAALRMLSAGYRCSEIARFLGVARSSVTGYIARARLCGHCGQRLPEEK